MTNTPTLPEIKVIPKFYAQQCPTCHGWTKMKYGTEECPTCRGKGYIEIPVKQEASK